MEETVNVDLAGTGVRLAGFIFAEQRDLGLCLRAVAIARDEVPPFHAREAFEIAIAANVGVASGSYATGDRLTLITIVDFRGPRLADLRVCSRAA